MRLKLLTVTNEMKVELTELNKYEGKLKQPNGPKANEGAFSEINETQVKLKELKQPVEGDHTKWKGTWARGEPLGAGKGAMNFS